MKMKHTQRNGEARVKAVESNGDTEKEKKGEKER